MTQPAEVSVNKSVTGAMSQIAESPASEGLQSPPPASPTQQGFLAGDSPEILRPLSSNRTLLVGSLLLSSGCALWAIGSNSGAQEVVSIIGVAGAVCVAVVALYAGIYGRGSKTREHDVLAFLPLGGLLLLGLSTTVTFFLGEAEFSPQAFAAPLVLAGVYGLMRGVAARAWERSGIESSAFFPPGGPEFSTIAQGGVVKLQTGQVVEVDSRVSAGSVAVQERYLSPITSFRVKDESEVIYAGSVVTGGTAEAVALSDFDGSCLRRLERCVSVQLEEAQSALLAQDGNVNRLVAFGLVFSAVSAAIFWNERGVSPAVVLAAAGLVLFAATLGLVADLVYSSFTGLVRGWARKGFVMLSGESFSVLAGTKDVAFDPSTLFSSELCRVRELEILDDRINREALCSTLASFLGRSEDVGLVAFGNYCSAVAASITPERVLDLREYPGVGVCGSIKGVEFSIGTEGFLVERGIMMQPSDGFAAVQPNERVLLVAIDSDVIARCVLSFGQAGLVSYEGHQSEWSDEPDTVASLATAEQREFSSDLLLVRGAESAALGRSHIHQVAPLAGDSLRPPQAAVLALTTDYSALAEMLRDCRELHKWAGLCRALVAAAGVVAVVSIFAGFTSIWVPLVLIPVITVLVLL